MHGPIKILTLVALLALASACAKEKSDISDLYGSGQYGGYQDNDQSYVAPRNQHVTGCTQGNLETFGC